jgi:outer membrane protein assembly factor BamD
MFRRSLIALLLAAGLLAGVGCHKQQKAANPLGQLNASKQPDKVLYDRAMGAMKQRKYDTARLTLQTLINAYPDSEYIAKAKFAVGESWYSEGTPAGLTQAETEFRDFITFFPNMPEAAEAQLKIADIHYRQMGKPDRDFTHARRAEEEYRLLLQQYPDSKFAETARLRLLEVQEILAEREFRIARFYYGRQSLLAAIARFKTLTDTYPLYSRADEALFLLGQSYEQQADRTRATSLAEAVKQRLISEYTDDAAEAYRRIVTRYPAMPRYEEARQRLAALKQPVPTPTAEAIAYNQKEVASRAHASRYERFVADMGKHPDLSGATHYGQPSLTDPKETDAPYLAREINSEINSAAASGKGSGAIHLDAASGAATANQPAPRSTTASVNPSDVPVEAPAQLNEADSSSSADNAAASSSSSTSDPPPPNQKDDSKNASSSNKPKKKFHIHIPLPL